MPTLLAGRYRLDEQIASGGMGVVWRAHDTVLQRPVALKMLHEHLADDAQAPERFKREALMAASVQHPNMANVFDYVEDAGRPCIVMEFVDGETLADRIARDGALPARDVVKITDQVLAALDAAHRAGIVHRDIKPGNVLLCSDGTVKVTDFGIARTLADASLTSTGTIMGTAHYAAPEQVRGEPATSQTDIYALGVVMYEMLTGVRPFTGDTPVGIAVRRLSEDPPLPRTVRRDIPPRLEQLVMRAMAREGAVRFGSAVQMRDALAMLDGVDSTATAVMAAPGPDDVTVALRAAAPPVPASVAGTLAPVADAVPPAWAWRRLARWLAPLLLVVGAVIVGMWLTARPSIATVPTFQGKTLAQAEQLADAAGLELAVDRVENDAPKGEVLEQDPPAGTELETPATVQLVVSDGPPPCCDVPNVEGKTLTEARAALADAKLDAVVRYRETNDARAGTVLEQSVDAGTRLDPGDNVTVTVARAPL